MGRYVLKRLLWMIPVILGVAILIFTIMYFTPGDPVKQLLGVEATAAQVEAKREELGLNDPYFVQLGNYLADMFLHGNFGVSYVYGTSVMDELMTRLPYTLTLGLMCIVLQVLIGTPLGIIAATHQNGPADRFCMLFALCGVSFPNFWVAMLLVLFFAVRLEVLPPLGIDTPAHYILPCIANSFAGIATQARQMRSSMLETIRSDYVTTAMAKGMSRTSVVLKHALPNALIPVITVVGNGFAMMFGGTVVIESVFSIPGVGTYMTQAIGSRDYPVIRGSVVMLAIVFCIVMLLVDLVYAFVDPRIKAQYEGQGRRRKNG